MHKVRSNVTSVAADLPHLTSGFQEFCKKAHLISKARQVEYKTLQHYNELLEILEIPQLIDTCAKQELFDDALEIEQYTVKLLAAFPNVSLIKSTYAAVTESIAEIGRTLQQQLSGKVDLPTSLKIIGYLKRIKIYSDEDLLLVFLHAKSIYLNDQLAFIPPSNLYLLVG